MRWLRLLALPSLIIGPEIDPGVPALRGSPSLTLALKSGNFGAEVDFFVKAAACLAKTILARQFCMGNSGLDYSGRIILSKWGKRRIDRAPPNSASKYVCWQNRCLTAV